MQNDNVKFKVIFLSILLFGIFGLTKSTWATDWYVAKGKCASACDGTTWSKAWNEMNQIGWSSVHPGDTVWLAGGTYNTAITPAVSGESDTNRIYIKRVRSTDAAPTSVAGWNSDFDSQVVISPGGNTAISLRGYSNITIDGRVDSGIKVIVAMPDPAPLTDTMSAVECGWNSTPMSNITIQYVDIQGPGLPDGSTVFNNDYRGFNTTHGAGLRNVLLSHCNIHGFTTLIFTAGTIGITVEYCNLYNNKAANSATYHPNAWASYSTDDVIFRYSQVYDYVAEGLMLLEGTPQINWEVYGNLFRASGKECCTRVLEPQGATHGPMYFYNNTVVDLWIAIRDDVNTIPIGKWSSNSESKNNIFWNLVGDGEMSTGTNDYNFHQGATSEVHGVGNGSNPFVDYAGQDYRIVSTIGATYPRNKGVSLTSEYSTDRDGNMRGSDGAWDIGAYEYMQGGDRTPPAAPTGLSVR